MKYVGHRKLKRELIKNYGKIEACFKRANFALEKKGLFGNAASWICDNFYIIDKEYRILKQGFSELEKLPADGENARIFLYTESFVSQRIGVDSQSISDFLKDNFLESEELYSFNFFLKLSLMKLLAATCDKMMCEANDNAFCMSKFLCSKLEYCINGLRESNSYDAEKTADGASRTEKMLLEYGDEYYFLLSPSSRRQYRQRIGKNARKLGMSETDYVKMLIDESEKEDTPLKRHIGYKLFPKRKNPFRYFYFVFTVLFAILFSAMFFPLCSYWCILILPAAYELGKQGADILGARLCVPTPLLSLEYKSIPDDCKTLCVTTALLSENNDGVFDNLEDFYLSNKDKNAYFGILADLPESDSAEGVSDEKLLEYAMGRIEALNLKYGGGFCFFYRGRSYSVSEGKYMGWERKRGAVLELVRFLRGNADALSFFGDKACAERIKYVVTLDSDTLLSLGDVKRLVGYMSHPLNRPVTDAKRKIVTEGYGIMQPRMSPVLESAFKSPFSFIVAGSGGLDIYQNARYDSYQELFGEGIFCGKGIFDVDAFLLTLNDAFPENIVLSHDILEGARLRTALICDMCLYDSVPANGISYFKRNHRWIRGDVQALCFARKRVPDASGKRVKNPINALSKYKIYDSVRRDFLPLVSVIAVICAAFLPTARASALLTGALSYTLFPILYGLCGVLFSSRASLLMRRFYSRAAIGIYRAAMRVFFELCSLFYGAQCAVSAGIRSIYRVNFSHKNTLEWVTAAEADKAKSGFYLCISKGFFSAITGAILVFFSKNLFSAAIGMLWVIFPLFIYFTGKSTVKKKTVKNKEKFKAFAKDIWRFYESYVNLTTNFLPPDNVSVSPKKEVAMRTSPTNIGFYLASVLGARDFGFIGTADMYERIANTVSAVESLEKWNGHLYNWYDISNKTVLGRPYVSTVDSGNFCALMLVLREGMLEYASEDSRLPELAERVKMLYKNADFSLLYREDRNLLSLGFDTESGKLDKTCYDLLMSEARLTSYFALATGALPSKHWYALSRQLVISGVHIGLASWTGTAFEYFMPALLLPVYENSLTDEALRHCVNMQKKKTAKGLWGCSESGYYAFDGDMNYQYKAFGCGSLALKSDVDNELVISPYSSFLFTQKDSASAYRNLINLRDRGFYGRFGFYEAADFTKERVGSGCGIVKSYMAHHVGMSFVACINLCLGNLMQKRFMHDPEMRSARSLLCEAIPSDAVVSKNKYKTSSPERKSRFIKDAMVTVKMGGERKTAVISNNRTCIVADSKGRIAFFDGDIRLNIPDTGLKLFAVIQGRTKELFSSDETLFEYNSTFLRYSMAEEGFKASTEITLSARGAVIGISCEIESDFEVEHLILYYEPLGETASAYLSHSAYVGLFTEAQVTDNSVIMSVKNRGENAGSRYICTASYENVVSINTKKDKLFPNGFDKEILDSGVCDCSHSPEGVLLYPMCAIKSELSKKGKKYTASFAVCSSDEREEAYKLCTSELSRLKQRSDAVKGELSSVCRLAYEVSRFSENDTELYERIKNALTVKEENPFSGNVRGLWKFGISGDIPIVLCSYKGENTEKISSLLRIHRLLTVKNYRFNPVILCYESDGYLKANKKTLARLTEELGSAPLIGAKSGIFFIEADLLSKTELENLRACCAADIDGKAPYSTDITDSAVRKVFYSEPVTDEFPVKKEVYGGYFTADGFVIDREYEHPPWSFVMASHCFGTVICENSFGYSYVLNSQMGMISKRSSDLLSADHGEKLRLLHKGTLYDLAACSKWVYFGKEGASYFGSIDGAKYRIDVGISQKDFIKSFSIRIEGARGAKLVFKTEALMGERGGNISYSKEGKLFAFSKKGGFLTAYKGFNFLENGVLIPEKREWEAYIDTDIASFHAYIGAYRTEEHRARMEALCDGRAFLADLDGYLPSKRLESEYEGINAFADFWLPYQNTVCRILARSGHYQCSGAYGFRDQLQDAANIARISPNLLKVHIVRCAFHQFEKGDVLHWWHKTAEGIYGIRTRCSDDRLWLIYAVSEYIKSTGDVDILKTQIPFVVGAELSEGESERCMYVIKSKTRASLYKHLLLAIELSLDVGAHGLPFIGSCDWNDSMNSVGKDGHGESVWLGLFFCVLAKRFVPLCKAMGDEENAAIISAKSKQMIKSLKTEAYEYGQYIRAYYGDGTPIGSKLESECKTDLITQAFAVFADIESDERLESILDSIESLWDNDAKLLRLLAPAFSHCGERYPGYIRDYPKGVRENGGQYTHAAMWGIIALFIGGRERAAKKMLLELCPAEKCSDVFEGKRYALEPYAVAGDVYSYGERAGRGGWSWYTGAAGWMLRAIEIIFGKRD